MLILCGGLQTESAGSDTELGERWSLKSTNPDAGTPNKQMTTMEEYPKDKP